MPIKLPDFLQKLSPQPKNQPEQKPSPESESLSPNLLEKEAHKNALDSSLSVFTELYYSKTLVVLQIIILSFISIYLLTLGLNIMLSMLISGEQKNLEVKSREVAYYLNVEKKVNDLTYITDFYKESKSSSGLLSKKITTIVSNFPSDIRLLSMGLDTHKAELYLSSDSPLVIASLLDVLLNQDGVSHIELNSVIYDPSTNKVNTSLGVFFK